MPKRKTSSPARKAAAKSPAKRSAARKSPSPRSAPKRSVAPRTVRAPAALDATPSARFRDLLPVLIDGVADHALFLLDQRGRVLTWSLGAEQIFGLRASEVIGQPFEVLDRPEERKAGAAKEALEEAAASGRHESEGYRVRKDGSKFWADVIVTRLAPMDGVAAAYSVVARDLTIRRRAAEVLKESEERFKLLVEAVKDYAIFMLDPTGHVLTWNAGAERFKGYKAKEIIGRHFSTFYPEADVKAGKTEMELEVAARDGRFEDEGWRVRKDGTLFWANVIITALRDAKGELVGFAKVTRDLTEKRRAEEELRQSEQRLRLLVSSVKDYAIFRLDPKGNVETWNEGAERIKGWTAKEIIGHSIKRFYTPEDLAAGKPERLLGIAAREGRVEDEGWRVRKNGQRFWADAVITAIRGPDGELQGFAKVTRDLTERREAEQERLRRVHAEEAVRLRDEFLSIASHELKTPLTALRLQLESMAGSVEPLSEKTAKRLERAARSTDKLVDLVETLLDVSRIATGRMTLRPEKVNVAELVHGVVERLAQSAEAAGCTLTVVGDGAVDVVWDRMRVEQVLTNFLANAFRYASGTPVELRMEHAGDEVTLTLSDRGPGFDEAARDRIFARFERASSSRHYGGLGLGLYVSREIVEAHGGRISAENVPGGGARFQAVLPKVAVLREHPEGNGAAEARP